MLSILNDSKVIHLEDIHDANDTIDGALIDAACCLDHRVIFDYRNIRRAPVYHQGLHANFDEILASQLSREKEPCQTSKQLGREKLTKN